jgi:hypothetical protein
MGERLTRDPTRTVSLSQSRNAGQTQQSALVQLLVQSPSPVPIPLDPAWFRLRLR